MKRYWPQYLLLALVVAVVFGQAFTFEFVRWDDETLILKNPYVARFTWLHVTEAWKAPYRLLYIPLTYNVWAFLGWFTSSETSTVLDPRFFHGANVLLHLGSCCLVFALLNRCFRNAWAALAGALVWSIHPLQVEPVAWATGMKDVLSGVLAIAAIHVHLIAVDHKGARGLWLRIGAVALLLLASCAKPGVIAVPFIALAFQWLLMGRTPRRSILDAIPLLAAVVPAAIITQVAQTTTGTVDTPIWARPLIAGHALTTYLAKLVWPASVCIDYGLRPDRVMAGVWWRIAWIIPVGLMAAVFLAKGQRRKVLVAAWLIFLAGVAPVLGFLPFVFQYYSTVADRYVYLSMLGVAALVTWLLTRIPLRFAVIGAMVVIAALAIRSTIQTGTWLDSATLLQHAMDVNPKSFVAPTNYAKMLMDEATAIRNDMLGKDANDPRVKQWLARADEDDVEAEGLVTIALQNNPTYFHALNNKAVFQVRRGEMNEALKTLQIAVEEWDRLSPDVTRDAVDRLTVAQAAMNLGRYEQAIDNLEKFLQRNPGHQQAEALLREAKAKLAANAASQPSTAPAGEAK